MLLVNDNITKEDLNMPNHWKEFDHVVTSNALMRTALVWLLAIGVLLIATKSNSQELRSARILVRSVAKIEVRTEIIAPVAALPFREGQQFKTGDVLISFDCARYNAEKSAAGAAAHASNIEHRTKRKLLKFKAVGKDEVRLAAALLAKANAELKVHQLRTSHCNFKAPFDGRIVAQNVNEHEFPTNEKPLMTILDNTNLELQLVVPSKWMRWIDVGREFRFEIDETGNSYLGEIVRLGAEVDPVSQTIAVTAKFKSRIERVLAGMSGTAFFDSGS